MNERKLKIITWTGMWLAAVAGSVFGLYLTIIGYITDSGPGGSMEGPWWKILLTGVLSILIGAYVGELIVRKLLKKMLADRHSHLETALRSFAAVLLGSMAAFIAGWEVGFILGKISGTIEGLDWLAVLVYTPLMSFIYGIPVSLTVAMVFGVFVFFYSREKVI